jgi:hypothetical protein
MKRTLSILLLLSAIQMVSAQENMPRKDALKYAFILAADPSTLRGTAIPTDVDVKSAVGVSHGEYGALLLPETKLSPDSLKVKGVAPLGQLWLHKIAPAAEGEKVDREALRVVTVRGEEESASVVQCALGAMLNDSGGIDLCIFGKGKTPLFKVPLKKVDKNQEYPIEIRAERGSEGTARIILNVLGKYEGSFQVKVFED